MFILIHIFLHLLSFPPIAISYCFLLFSLLRLSYLTFVLSSPLPLFRDFLSYHLSYPPFQSLLSSLLLPIYPFPLSLLFLYLPEFPIYLPLSLSSRFVYQFAPISLMANLWKLSVLHFIVFSLPLSLFFPFFIYVSRYSFSPSSFSTFSHLPLFVFYDLFRSISLTLKQK